jgi:hypothetical protein
MRRHNIIILAVAVVLLAGCKTKERVVTMEKVRTDTLMKFCNTRDSIWLHDSIRVSEKGDTIRIERWHTKYVEREVHDTLYQSKHDSVPVPYEVVREVAKPLTWWQRTRLHMGEALLALIAAAACFGLWRLKK